MNRKPTQAGLFYPAHRKDCLSALQKCLPLTTKYSAAIAGIVPHAGWIFSGSTAGKVYRAIQQAGRIKTFIVFGAVHVQMAEKAAIWSKGGWETPLGTAQIDEPLAQTILKNTQGLLEDNPQTHILEHSIEVQIPFIQHLFPDAKLVPIMVTPFARAHEIGERLASILGEETVVLGSSDLTHYGIRFGFAPKGTGENSLKWAKQENDQRMIELMLQVNSTQVVAEGNANHNSCGHGAIAATLGYARAKGKTKGILLEHTTSYEVYPERKADCSVGYAGIVF